MQVEHVALHTPDNLIFKADIAFPIPPNTNNRRVVTFLGNKCDKKVEIPSAKSSWTQRSPVWCPDFHASKINDKIRRHRYAIQFAEWNVCQKTCCSEENFLIFTLAAGHFLIRGMESRFQSKCNRSLVYFFLNECKLKCLLSRKLTQMFHFLSINFNTTLRCWYAWYNNCK